MTKVISFSLWGNNLKYCVGAIKNAKLAQTIYPDWVCRFYVATDVPTSIQGELANLDNVDLCEMPPAFDGWKGMFSRFLPASEAEVEVMISRDCDSRLSLREKEAVDEWLASDKQFHIMRDHPWHGTEILGGMFGMKHGVVPDLESRMIAWLNKHNPENEWQIDQNFLKAEIYPLVVNDSMVHAQFHRIEHHARPFPSLRSDLEFVGQVFDENEVTIQEHVDVLRKYI